MKDVFLKLRMDDEGWIPLSVLANFNRVRNMIGNVDAKFILDTMRSSQVVEIREEDNKIRRKGDWQQWVFPPDVCSLKGLGFGLWGIG